MKNASFPRWAGPLVGAVAGALFAGRAARRQGQGFSVEWMTVGAVIGAVGGIFVWLLDKPKAEGAAASDALQGSGVATQPEASLVARFLAVLAVLLCLFPLVGPILGGIAWFVNRQVRGWPKVTSIVGTCIGVLVTMLLIIAVVMNPGPR
jgi:hypothetical protein